jgi:hypothetical protein
MDSYDSYDDDDRYSVHLGRTRRRPYDAQPPRMVIQDNGARFSRPHAQREDREEIEIEYEYERPRIQRERSPGVEIPIPAAYVPQMPRQHRERSPGIEIPIPAAYVPQVPRDHRERSPVVIMVSASDHGREHRYRERHHERHHDREHRRHANHEVVRIPEGHDVTADYFQYGFGMWDHDMLLRESQLEAQRQSERAAAERQAEVRQRAAAEEHEARRRFAAAREELRSFRENMQRFERSRSRAREDADDRDGGAGPSRTERRRREKSSARGDDEPDGCCERLLRFMQEESEIQHYRWRELRGWQEILTREMLHSRAARQLPLPQTVVIVHNSSSRAAPGGQDAGSAANVFPRPSWLGGMRGSASPAADSDKSMQQRKVRVGFMFLTKGNATHSRELHQYSTVAIGVTTKRDVWIIDLMNEFYASRVASRRWLPLKRLALAKFVRASGPFSRCGNIGSRMPLNRWRSI